MCLDLLKECDIVVTNPMFSLWRQYVAQLIKYGKQFLIIGNKNAITYKEIFPLLKEDMIWLGHNTSRGTMHFIIPGSNKLSSVPSYWYTNIDHPKRHQMIDFPIGCTYFGHEEMYPAYDNYNAINVDKTNNIPCDYFPCISVPVSFAERFDSDKFVLLPNSFEFKRDTRSLGGGEPGTGRWYVKRYTDKAVIYVNNEEKQDAVCRMMMTDYNYSADEIERYNGVIGVPISFLDKYCPEQFEIIGLAPERLPPNEAKLQIKRYSNVFRHNEDGSVCNVNKVINAGPVIAHDEMPSKWPWYTCEDVPGKYLEVVYARILIKRK